MKNRTSVTSAGTVASGEGELLEAHLDVSSASAGNHVTLKDDNGTMKVFRLTNSNDTFSFQPDRNIEYEGDLKVAATVDGSFELVVYYRGQ